MVGVSGTTTNGVGVDTTRAPTPSPGAHADEPRSAAAVEPSPIRGNPGSTPARCDASASVMADAVAVAVAAAGGVGADTVSPHFGSVAALAVWKGSPALSKPSWRSIEVLGPCRTSSCCGAKGACV